MAIIRSMRKNLSAFYNVEMQEQRDGQILLKGTKTNLARFTGQLKDLTRRSLDDVEEEYFSLVGANKQTLQDDNKVALKVLSDKDKQQLKKITVFGMKEQVSKAEAEIKKLIEKQVAEDSELQNLEPLFSFLESVPRIQIYKHK